MSGHLPRFRRDLRATPVQQDGVAFIDLEDPKNGLGFRLYEFEYEVAQKLDGRTLDEVARWAGARFGFEATADGMAEFAERLRDLGFLEGAAPAPPATNEAPAAPTPADFAPAPDSRVSAGLTPAALADGGRFAKLADAGVAAEPPAWPPELPSEAYVMEAPSSPALVFHETELEASTQPESVTERLAAAVPTTAAPPPSAPRVTRPFEASPGAGRPAIAPPPERRQPPPPTAVVMPPVVEETARAAPAPEPPSAPQPAIASPPPAVAARPAIGPPPSMRGVAAGVPRGPRRWLFPAAVLLATAAVVGAVARVLTRRHGPVPLAVRVVSPTPSSVYRWFATPGVVKAGAVRTLTFEVGGKVIEVLPTGTTFRAGDVIAKLDGSRRAQSDLAHIRERLAYYEQMRETMTAGNNRSEIRQAEVKVAEKKRLLADALAALAKTAVVPTESGEIVEPLAAVGTIVVPGAAALKVKGTGLRAEFVLAPDDAARARRLDFCRVELPSGRPADCSFVEPESEAIVVELPPSTTATPGQAVRLARSRFEAVFPVASSAIVRVGETDRLFVAGPRGRAEVRAVALAERTPTEALVSQGIDVGDSVIVDVPPGLADGSPVRIQGVK